MATVSDVIELVRSWIKPISFEEEEDGGNDIIYYHGSTWIQTHGFQKGPVKYRIYRNEWDKYAVDARIQGTGTGSGAGGWCGEVPPSIGIYTSWDEMLDAMASYCE